MNKVISIEDIESTALQLHAANKQIVLVGGCFDILHKGHMAFLEQAKKEGDILMVLLESDTSITKWKGEGKPVNMQTVRAGILAALTAVDYVIVLPALATDEAYDNVVLMVKPAIIATTNGDPARAHKERQAKMVQAHVVDVIERLPDLASSSLAKEII